MLKYTRAVVLLMIVAYCLVGRDGFAAETINVYTYHIHPPFVNSGEKGQTYDLTYDLEKAAGGKYTFQLNMVPRSRLNMLLKQWVAGECYPEKRGECHDNWILLWVNQKWGFGPEPEKNFNWVKIVEDSNSIISRQEHKVEYASPDSLIGLNFGGISGHKYVGIDTLAEEGKLRRINGSSERDNILKLYKNRVDVILLPSSTIRYFMFNDPTIKAFADKLYIAPVKHQTYTRHIMIPKSRDDLKQLCKSIDMTPFQ